MAPIPPPATRPTEVSVAEIVDLIGGCAYQVNTERDLHDAICGRLADAGVPHTREAWLSPRDRVDVLAGGVAIEVKTAGSLIDVLRQCQRYARSPMVDSVLLVTTVPDHHGAPLTVGGKALTVLGVRGGWLA